MGKFFGKLIHESPIMLLDWMLLLVELSYNLLTAFCTFKLCKDSINFLVKY